MSRMLCFDKTYLRKDLLRFFPLWLCYTGLVMLAAVVPALQRGLLPLLSAIPAGWTYAMLLLFTADAVASFRVLQVTGDPEALSLRTG